MGKSSKRQRSQATTADDQRVIKSVFGRAKAMAREVYGVTESDVTAFAQTVYCILLTCVANHEENMKKAGIEVPKLVEYRVKDSICRDGGEVERAYVPCNRCEFCQACGTEYECAIKREVVDGSYTRYYVTNYDGCSKGILRKEYR